MLLFKLDSINAVFLSIFLGGFFSFFLRYHAEYSKTVEHEIISPSQTALIVRHLVFQSTFTIAITIFQLEPFRVNFPKIFHFKDPYTIAVVVCSVLYCLTFNTYIVIHGENTKYLTNWFRVGTY
ncbi:hypothetical protein BKA69DRAFT_630643 [Paraphysoderma sedebokerense]|nr:hypothetical protein BKA69DRAFT_630643 [Paraphysoderma sedebokerense]